MANDGHAPGNGPARFVVSYIVLLIAPPSDLFFQSATSLTLLCNHTQCPSLLSNQIVHHRAHHSPQPGSHIHAELFVSSDELMVEQGFQFHNYSKSIERSCMRAVITIICPPKRTAMIANACRRGQILCQHCTLLFSQALRQAEKKRLLRTKPLIRSSGAAQPFTTYAR